MLCSYGTFLVLGVVLTGRCATVSSTSRGQFYQAGRSARSQPSSNSPALPTSSSIIISNHDPQEALRGSKAPFTVIRGQYSKSELVNTQSVSHSFIHDPDMPIFDLDHSGNVTALLGKTAVLNCRVRNIGNKTVSWVRHRDIHLLTVGRFSYTSDQRFTARHADESEDWLLKIHYLQKRDAGWYGCQISTTPPVSHMVYLSVVEPETSILGGPDVYINSGSRLALTCTVKYSPEPPAFIFWYHNDKLVSYDQSSRSVQVVIEKGEITTSRLLVQVAGTEHSGRYTCDPSDSGTQSVTVHVLEGEKPAAIQHENNSATAASPPSAACCTLHATIATFIITSIILTAIFR